MNRDRYYRMAVRAAVLIVLLAWIVSQSAFAGRGDKAGTAGVSELLLPVGASAISMGGASLSTVAGLEAAYWNPAGVARSPWQTIGMVSHMGYLAGVSVDFAGVAIKAGEFGSIAFDIKSVTYGDIAVTTEDQPDGTGEITSPSTVVLGGTVARSITDHIAFGISGNYFVQTMAKVSSTGLAFTGGLQYTGMGGIEGLAVGVVVRNVGEPVRFGGEGLTRQGVLDSTMRTSSPLKVEAAANDLPSTIEFGVGYSIPTGEESQIQVNSAFQNNNYSDDEYRIGVAYEYGHYLNLRGGLRYLAADDRSSAIFGPSFGIGLATSLSGIALTVDYGYESVQYFGGNNIIALQAAF